MICTIKFARVRPNATIPTKRDEDGCYDLYACIDKPVVIPSHTVKLIPTGIASAFDVGYRIGVRERGSNTKSTLITMAGQIDSGYRGEWFIALYNGNDVPVEISDEVKDIEKTEDYIRVPISKAIAQFAIEVVPDADIEEYTLDELNAVPSTRGSGCLGSSGK